ncbi:NAD(P)-binding protein [Conidiobolus coronatus NRRL 28638]|uniref:NAD(P)-binding protein n=1 Tax=Conidiobolus coronatus (strain ATCC 28846 / CBS 209.66 / NRRL 28638) TaxID=796925 RepID=A0A137PF48_CONC2|nr:NAD(P)-binding protein [Conidiobolus coronatus NRRL 28638]|eukprot:KXN73610.1 NAD(P)-binding protein [Conidiobolus coronatus NRRL 28638]
MNTKVCIITGGNSGIGYEVVKKLLTQNYTVIIGCRDSPKTEAVLTSLDPNYKENRTNLIHIPLDLSDFTNVREFVDKFNELGLQLNLLINNAGTFYNNEGLKNSEGIDNVLATNYYGHFLLTYLLMDKLKSTEGSRVANVSSSLFKDFQ